MNIRANSSVGAIILVMIGGGLLALTGCTSSTGARTTCHGAACPVAAQVTPATAQSATPSVPATSSVTPAPTTQAATQAGQRIFASPDAAAEALKSAATAGDRQALLAIFGSDGEQLIFSGDPVEEANGMKKFAGHLAEYLRIDLETPSKAVLYIGLKNWPFPIPVVKSDKGWTFDTAAGKEELLDRRIGANELNAISVCRAYVTAQKAYAQKDRMGDKAIQYAQHFRSSEGKEDGLYWPASGNEEVSPMGPLVAEAQGEGYMKEPKAAKHEPYHGYFFHILKGQGDAAPGGKMSYIVDGRLVKGFAMIAWPDSWGSSGIMTFIVNQDGKVYQKNLGEKTAEAAKDMAEYNPDGSWTEVKD